FADAVHPTHAVRPAGCWAPRDTKIAIAGTSGRQRLNLHGAVDLETGATRMLEVTTVDAVSTIALLMAIVTMYPTKTREPAPRPQARLGAPSERAGALAPPCSGTEHSARSSAGRVAAHSRKRTQPVPWPNAGRSVSEPSRAWPEPQPHQPLTKNKNSK